MVDWKQYVSNGRLTVLVKPKSTVTQIVSFDVARDALQVDVRGIPEGNEVNLNLIKFFSKLSGKKVSIVSGLTSRKKFLRFS